MSSPSTARLMACQLSLSVRRPRVRVDDPSVERALGLTGVVRATCKFVVIAAAVLGAACLLGAQAAECCALHHPVASDRISVISGLDFQIIPLTTHQD
ncbi:hypothetical protein ABT288_35345 [Streptomyces sp. NPDC001093]|uniref:hypothetical protein n=1 Tax=Streptomyces sp. NPDC001093 TaxID=3154376 RepID=UPI00331DCD63